MEFSRDSTVLYGMMGCGKTTLGRGLAEARHEQFRDIDELIEQATGLTPAQIIEDPNLDFAAIQAQVIQDFAPFADTVVATGGSVAMYPDLVSHLNSFGPGVFINVDPEVLEARLGPDRIAALNNPDNLSFPDLYRRREPFYRKAGQFVLNVSPGETPEESAQRLVALRSAATSIFVG